MLKFIRFFGFLGFLSVTLYGCADGAFSGAAKMEKANVWVEKVRFKLSPVMNEDSPVTVALVVAYDPEVLTQLSKMTANQYFGQEGTQLKSDSGNKIQEFKWEIPIGQEKEDEEINLEKAYGQGAFVFAHYQTTDAHRQALSHEHVIMIHLDEKDFWVESIS
jgi:hypothetical protein